MNGFEIANLIATIILGGAAAWLSWLQLKRSAESERPEIRFSVNDTADGRAVLVEHLKSAPLPVWSIVEVRAMDRGVTLQRSSDWRRAPNSTPSVAVHDLATFPGDGQLAAVLARLYVNAAAHKREVKLRVSFSRRNGERFRKTYRAPLSGLNA